MNKVKVYNTKGEETKEAKLNPQIFDIKINLGLIQQVAEAQLANARQVLAHTKTRGEKRGGGKKPWRQKGTGRARHGSIRSPLWVGGGVTFGPRNTQNFSKRINKKMKKKALFMCLSDKVQSNWLILLDELKTEKPSTKNLLNILKKLPVVDTKTRKIKIQKKGEKTKVEKKEIKQLGKILIIVSGKADELCLSARNLKNIEIIRADSLNVVDILRFRYLVVLVDSLDVIEKIYLK